MKKLRFVGWSVLLLSLWVRPAVAALTVEIVNGYNLVVDSNVTAPSTYAPGAAYIGARICNTGGAPLDNVVVYAGDNRGGAGDTPGLFPAVSFGADPLRPHLAGTGSYALTLEAGATGAADGTRYIGTLGPGSCRMQYWLVSYPQCVNVGGEPQAPPCDVSVTGSIQPDDDLTLDYDVWATSTTGPETTVATRGLTLRNEISAAANKIWPNTTSKVPDAYLAAIQSVVGWGTIGPDGQPLTSGNPVYPGQRLITTQGIWYDLGNVGQGFDNDGDLLPDQNAWLQPVGDPSSFDADCFRLVNVYGIVIVKLKSGGELLIPFQNELYFRNIPDNTGVVGLVYYQYLATDAGCSGNLTPYQEAASGFGNEKFSADYGLSLGLASGGYGGALGFTKSDGVTTVAPGGALTYALTADNQDTGVNLGAPDLGTPLVFHERIPAGTTFVAGSADDSPAANLTEPAGSGSFSQGYTDADGNLDTCTIDYTVAGSSFTLLYSADNGATWTLAEPPAATVTDVAWLLLTRLALDGYHNGTECVAPDGVFADGTLETSLPVGQAAEVRLQVTVQAAPPPVLCNTAALQYGLAASGVAATDCDLVTGGNSLAGTVFRDDGAGGGIFGNGAADGAETGIGGVAVELYYDADGDGRHGAADLLYAATATAADGSYAFAGIPDGPFVVAVRKYGFAGAGNDVDDVVPGWGDTTYDPNLPLTTDQGILKLGEDLGAATLAVNVDYLRDSGPQALAGVSFGFAPPLRLTKAVENNPDANADGRADLALDEGDVFSYVISLENRLPSVGRQGPSGCEYTVWAGAGATGNSPKNFTNPANAYDAASPNGSVASALVDGGGLRWIYGRSPGLAPQLGNITKVEALYFGYFSKTLSDDFLTLEASFGADNNGLTTPLKTGALSTAMIDSYVGPRADFDPNSAISWDISALRPGCTTCGVGDWSWTDFPGLYLLVKADKASAADAKYFYLDAVGVRVTSDKDCEAGASTTLSPVPLQDSYDTGSFAFVSAEPPPTSVDAATGVIRWDDVGPILPGTTKTVTVRLRALNVSGLRTGACGASSPPATGSACNWAETAWGGKNVSYADGRRANDDSGRIAVSIQGKGELRGVLWKDTNVDGWPDNDGEPKLPNVAVTLFGCVKATGTMETATANKTCPNATNGNSWQAIATTLTGANGAYEFIGLDTGFYLVEVGDTDGAPGTGSASPFGGTQTAEPDDTQAVAAGSATGTNGVCAGGCNNTWGNPAANLNALNLLNSPAAEEIIGGVNFGYSIPSAVVYGNVWQDIDGDAAQGGGEGGLAGFTVRRYSDPNGDGNPADGTLQATTLSDASGDYAFSGLAAGSYVIVIAPPTLPSKAWVETVETTGGTGSLDNRIPVTLAAGAISGPHSFGYTQADTSAIGDTLWYDFDADGVRDPAEAGIPNVTVWLYRDHDRDGTVDAGVDELLATTATGASGTYLFAGLAAGSYVVRVDTADPDFPNDVTATGDPDTNAASIGDLLWYDLNGNGAREPGEDGIPGAVVNLHTDDDGSGTLTGADPLVASTRTDVNGAYLFTGLNAGRYFVDVDETSLPSAALALTTTDPASVLLTLADGTSATSALTADAGYSPAANFAVGNRVWLDADGDGVQDAGEVGIPGVRVVVTDGTGTGCAAGCTATTDAAGFWLVTGLTNGTFTVDLSNADLPRYFTVTTGTTDPRTVTVAGADLANVDFGCRYNTDANPLSKDPGDPTGSITGRVFTDADGDGAYDAGEQMGGTAVNLLGDSGEILGTTATAADGTYAFGGVFIGDYAVQTVDELGTRYSVVFLSAGEAFPNLNVAYSGAAESAPDSQSSVSVDGVHSDLTQDFGYQRFQGSIGDTVYEDANGNATQDAGERGLGGVTVRLLLWADATADGGNGDGLVDAGELTPLQSAATTADDPLTAADESGKYLFSNLEKPPAGRFFLVRVDTATLPGTASLVADPDTDGEACPLVAPLNPVCDGQQVVSGFSDGINYLGADFGYRITGSGNATVGDHLWVDSDGDGLPGGGELGVRFVSVWFDTDDDGVLDAGERSVQTDSDGYYVFTGVADGTYTLRVLTTDPDWPPTLPTTPVYEARGGNTTSLDNRLQVLVAGGAVTSIVDGDPGTADACTNCNLAADFGYRYAGANTLSGTICTESGTLDGFCGATATSYTGTGLGESPLAGIQVSLYRWTDDGDNTAWAGGTLDAGDTFTLLGSATTDANGDYVFAHAPDNVVVVLGVSPTQNLRLTTTNAATSVEDAGVVSRQLYEATSTYAGATVTVALRQALNLGPDADNVVQDLDFAFDGTLGGAIAHDFGDLPAAAPNYRDTLLADGGAQHVVTATSIYLGAGVSTETDGQPSPDAGADPVVSGDTGDDGVALIPGNWTVDPDYGAGVDVSVSADGWLAGWVDFNEDGDFADPGEQIVSQAVAAGLNSIAFGVPASITAGSYTFFSRFRVYPARPLLVSSTGVALDAAFQPAAGEVEDYQWNLNVTRVVVASFSARQGAGSTTVEWVTSSEHNTVGFNLLRRDGGGGEFSRVNPALLPALVHAPQGGTYRFVDPTAAPEGAEYVLEEVEASGRRAFHGPYPASSVDPGPPPAADEAEAAPTVRADGYSRQPRQTVRRAHPAADAGARGAATAAPRQRPPGSRAKIAVRETGIRYIGIAELSDALGVAVDAAKSSFKKNVGGLWNMGQPVAWLPADDYEGVYFYAERLDSGYALDNVYWAGGDKSPRIKSRPAGPARPRGDETFVRTVHEESDVYACAGMYADAGDDWWLWDYFFAGDPPKAFPVRADGLAGGAGDATLTVRLKGGSDTAVNPDHHAVIRVNGVQVGEIRWNGLEDAARAFAVPTALLHDGENAVEIDVLADTGAEYSLVYLDSLDLAYPSYFRAREDRLDCSSEGHAAILMSGFSSADVMVFDVTEPRDPVAIQAQARLLADGTYGVAVAPERGDRRYHATTLGAVRPVDSIASRPPTSLGAPANRGGYLVVTTAELRAAAQRLADLRGARGSLVVDVEDVYDEFGYGVASPLALKAFFARARAAWAQPPQMVLLAGDATYDYRDLEGAGGNLVPTLMVGTPHGIYPSDNALVDVVGDDGVPDLAIGRLPVPDAATLDAVVDKIVAREAAVGQPWKHQAILLADNPDQAGDFPADSDRIAGLATGADAVTRLHLPALTVKKARERLFAGLRSGAGIVNYVGHGGYDVLADERLLASADVATLANAGRPTILTALTCIVGNFAQPGYPALSQLLLRQSDGGAAAVWAPSGMSQDRLARRLAELFFASYFRDPGVTTVGEAVLGALQAYARGGGDPTLLDIFVLLGDPALELR